MLSLHYCILLISHCIHCIYVSFPSPPLPSPPHPSPPLSLPTPPLPSPLPSHPSPTTAATGTQLRCDVFVDTIHKIEITTTTRELLLEEAPEMFDVRAFDEEGTRLCVSLSSVHGVPQTWPPVDSNSSYCHKWQ